MTSWITSLLFVGFIALAHAQGTPIVVGAVVSQSGLNADLAAGYAKGIRVWEEQINAGGGLLGRPVVVKMLDDGSDAIRAAQLYRQLVGEAGAEALIGPYGSAATRAGAAEAERARRIMVNGAGPASAVQQGPSRMLIPACSAYVARGAGVLQLARSAGLTRLYILARQELAAQEIAEGTRLAALEQGFTVPEIEVFSPYTAQFTASVEKAVAAGAQAWIAFGEARDAVEMVKAFRKTGYAPQLFFARRAGDAAFIAAVGQDAELTLTDVEYDPRLAFPANPGFVAAYTARWGAPPDFAAAEGFTAASVLGAGVRRAGSLDSDKLRVALVSLHSETPLGDYRVGAAGRQLGLVPAVAQIQRGKLQVVWPEDLRTGQPNAPYLPWKDRQVIE